MARQRRLDRSGGWAVVGSVVAALVLATAGPAAATSPPPSSPPDSTSAPASVAAHPSTLTLSWVPAGTGRVRYTAAWHRSDGPGITGAVTVQRWSGRHWEPYGSIAVASGSGTATGTVPSSALYRLHYGGSSAIAPVASQPVIVTGPGRVHSALSVDAQTPVARGGRSTVTVSWQTATGFGVNGTVTVQRWTGDRWATYGSIRTRNGSGVARARIPSSAKYRVSFGGSAQVAPITSASTMIATAGPVSSALRMTATSGMPSGGKSRVEAVWNTATGYGVTGTLTLQRFTGGAWADVGRVRTSRGTGSALATIGSTGSYRLRYAGGPQVQAVVSTTVVIRTKAASRIDRRCLTGRVLCIDKTTRKLRWMTDGRVRRTMDVRFGSELTPTREGSFRVYWKSRYHVSSLFHTSMPFAMFFSGGQAVHYSPDFARNGYNGASHGCVNVRDYAGIRATFDAVRVGDRVIVYRS